MFLPLLSCLPVAFHFTVTITACHMIVTRASTVSQAGWLLHHFLEICSLLQLLSLLTTNVSATAVAPLGFSLCSHCHHLVTTWLWLPESVLFLQPFLPLLDYCIFWICSLVISPFGMWLLLPKPVLFLQLSSLLNDCCSLKTFVHGCSHCHCLNPCPVAFCFMVAGMLTTWFLFFKPGCFYTIICHQLIVASYWNFVNFCSCCHPSLQTISASPLVIVIIITHWLVVKLLPLWAFKSLGFPNVRWGWVPYNCCQPTGIIALTPSLLCL